MGYLPAGGFYNLATSKGLVRSTLKRVIDDYSKAFGNIEAFFDDAAFEECAHNWQERLFGWTETYRREFVEANGDSSGAETISHIKYAGCLLAAFTQGNRDPVEAVEVHGVLPDRIRDLIVAYPNEYLMFMAVYALFNEQQFQRDIPLHYNPEQPPMNPRYARAVVHYLRMGRNGGSEQLREPADFYMLFKTMDLYGADSGYKP